VFSGGQLVTITGTNFRLPYPVPATSTGPLPSPPPTVSVTVNGKAAKDVRVLSSTSLTCRAPAGDVGAATIVVKNLNAAGAPISGEVATAALIATYARVDLSAEDDFERVVRALLRLLRRQVIDNVVLTRSVDFPDAVGASEFNITDVASLPALAVSGPQLRENRFYSAESQRPVETRSGGAWARRRRLRAYDLAFRLTGLDSIEKRMLRLLATVAKVLEINQFLDVQRDAADETKGDIRYELDATEFAIAGAPNDSDVRAFSGEIVVKGVVLEDLAGFADSMVAEKGGTVDNVEAKVTSL